MNEFLWGVAISAYQAEGGYNQAGQPETNWAEAERAGDVAPVGAAADFWSRYAEDFARCRKLGLTAFRLSIEWSRIQPERDSSFDRSALNHYLEILRSCREHGMEPVVTLHHFVHPSWLGLDPWLEEKTPNLFVSFARAAVAYLSAGLSRPLRWLITINEPNMLVLNSYLARQFPAGRHRGARTMMKAYNQLLRAHVLTYNALHDLYVENHWEAPQITFNNYCSDVYWSDKVLLDLICARESGIARDQIEDHVAERAREFDRIFREAKLPLHRDAAFYFGTVAKRLCNWFGYKLFSAAYFSSFLNALYESPRRRLLDYIAIDYYDPFAAHAFRLPVWWDHEFKSKSLRSWILATVTSKWWDWRVLPRGLHFFCHRYARDYQRPVLIAENGMALRRRADGRRPRRDRINRSEFLRLHVHEVMKLLQEGVPLLGYLHWSLFDNYEWGTYTPRFGLYAIDFTRGTDRALTDPDGDCPAETYAQLIQESQAEDRSGKRVP